MTPNGTTGPDLTALKRLRLFVVAAIAAVVVLGGCATAPINPPITHADPTAGYRFQTRGLYARNKEDIVVLAFSGGGTRAAAFSYGVLEALRNTEVSRPATANESGCSTRLMSSPGFPVAASPPWPTACMATACSANTSSAFSSAMFKASCSAGP